MALHKNIGYANNHIIHSFEYADAAARGAASLSAGDIGKVARQLDDGSFWVLITNPGTWIAIASPGASPVATSRQIISGTGLTGGGDLSADRTLNVVANADGSIVANANDIQVGILATDAQHGVRGGGTQHSNVVAAGAAGFMTGADKTKLDNLPTTPKTDTFIFGNDQVATSTTARFLVPGYSETTAPTVAPSFRVPTAGTIRNLRVRHNTVGVGAATITYTLRKNGANQTLTCGMAATGSDASDLSNTFTVAAGDLLDLTITKSGTITTSPIDVLATVEFAP